MTLEQLIAHVESRGWRINNLFHRKANPPCWQANLYDDADCHEFGHGDTPAAALQAALDKAEAARKPASEDIFA